MNLSVILLLFVHQLLAQIEESNRIALESLYNSTRSSGWAVKWDLEVDLCGQFGVTCNNESAVTSLELNGNRLIGTIPPAIGLLTDVEELNLGTNSFTSALPTEVGALQNLRYLNMEFCDLPGNLPAQLGDLSRLEEIWLTHNNFDGPIPLGLQNNVNLTVINLDDNRLEGSIPSELGQLLLLEELRLNSNRLSGDLPEEIVMITTLVWVRMYSNELTGTIPTEVALLTNLLAFELQHNKLTGLVPEQWPAKLMYLHLADNQFDCPLYDYSDNARLREDFYTLYGELGCDPAPTSVPTPFPTPIQTLQPTLDPTPMTTDAPTHPPTLTPTNPPTPEQTDPPTPSPTPVQTVKPTPEATRAPTLVPVPLETAAPFPTPFRTPRPSALPTPGLTRRPTELPVPVITFLPTFDHTQRPTLTFTSAPPTVPPVTAIPSIAAETTSPEEITSPEETANPEEPGTEQDSIEITGTSEEEEEEEEDQKVVIQLPPQTLPTSPSSPQTPVPTPIQTSAVETREDKGIYSFGATDAVSIVALILFFYFLILYIMAKKRAANEENAGRALALFVVGMALFDFIGDCCFATYVHEKRFLIFGTGNPNDLFFSSAASLIITAVANLIATFIMFKMETKIVVRNAVSDDAAQSSVSDWYREYYSLSTLILLFSITSAECITLLGSNAFHLLIFSAGFSAESLRKMSLLGLIGNLTEDVPQLIFQISVLSSDAQISLTVILALIGTVMSLVYAVIGRICLKHCFYRRVGETSLASRASRILVHGRSVKNYDPVEDESKDGAEVAMGDLGLGVVR